MATQLAGLDSGPPLTSDEFEALAEEQGWDEDTRIELLDGEVVWMNPVNSPHIGCINRLNQLFSRCYPLGAVIVSVQNPVRLGPYDQPQPDVVLLKPRADYYGTSIATGEDILLLVEVSDSTLRTDLGRKARVYAGGGVPEYWVIDLNGPRVYVHRDSSNGAYQARAIASRGERISTLFAPSVDVAVDEILG